MIVRDVAGTTARCGSAPAPAPQFLALAGLVAGRADYVEEMRNIFVHIDAHGHLMQRLAAAFLPDDARRRSGWSRVASCAAVDSAMQLA